LFEAAGSEYGNALVLSHLGALNRVQGDSRLALTRLEQALPALRGDPGGEILALRNIGQSYQALGDRETAQVYLSRALALARDRELPRSEAQTLFFLGLLLMQQGRVGEAEPLFDDVHDLSRAVGDRAGEAHALRAIGLCRRAAGDLDRAEASTVAALRLVAQPRPTSAERMIRQDLESIRGKRPH
jgi:tetratricopeptide (TPR) repeat protein